ncbi:P-loop containing nucleoside triphosphate hydrolase protein [Crucibulum laeve]|uniref:RNA helicase n=1 Tax=Crucibulum laeve TaxID=68775 RepID=A0A5C3M7J8_9AGAR|nr:P-loop containing nucleoside triphosphate hydrolase protein [Crucibulum laeve]
MSHVRERYNAKARGSTAGGGSKKKGKQRKQNAVDVSEVTADPNARIVIAKTKEEKEKERKEKLLEELSAQSESKWTSKKKKRLEKYIDKKLKKEERVLIFEKLAQSQASLSSALLQSSSTLGTGKLATHLELQERQEDKEVRKVLEGRLGKRKRYGDGDMYDITGPDGESEDEDMLSDFGEKGAAPSPEKRSAARSKEVIVIDSTTMAVGEPVKTTISAVGSALQRNADGTVVAPKIRPRKQGKGLQKGWGRTSNLAPAVDADSDTSFDSSDSAYDSSEDEDESFKGSAPPNKKTLGFKDWAMKQLSVAKGYNIPSVPKETTTSAEPPPPSPLKKKRKLDGRPHDMHGPLGEDLQLPSTTFVKQLLDQEKKKSSYIKAVDVKRPPDVEEARMLLPIVSEEQPIMEAILLNPVIIICGETGSGKTTQVPQFLFEAGFGTPGSENPGMIGITQPRRVAAMSMAARVSHELSLTSSRVSYQIRYDATVSSSTSIKFMTDGVLLRELATDFLLEKYSVIIIDEAHERSMNTDILIGVLSRVIKLRSELWKEGKDGAKPLRLIIMSATLRVSDFAENKTLFPSPPPVINVAARQHPVTVHFSRRTSSDYVTEAIKKTTKIHTRLPPGGVLIFLTGQNEITGVCRKLEAKFGKKALEEKKRRRGGLESRMAKWAEQEHGMDKKNVAPAQADVEAEDVDLGDTVQDDLAIDVDENMDEDDPDALNSDNEDDLNEELGIEEESDTPMHIVPLYSLLPSEKQMRVFQPPPPDSRLIVVSTNVAETSLTIPGIRYVVDCGRAKERRYDVTNGIQAFQIGWVSKASAAQRAGRAGRTGPGHCYRLYSSALFEHHFDQFSTPEILRMPIEGVVLQMKSMHIDAVVNFPFPTPPDRPTLQKAEKTLTYLGALANPSSSVTNITTTTLLPSTTGGQITDLGRTMALFPLSPRFSRMLVSGQQHSCLPYVISMVSAMSVGDPFLYEEAIQDANADDADMDSDISGLKSEAVKAKEAQRTSRKAFFHSQHIHSSLGKFTSDMFKMLSVVGAYEYEGGGLKFCSSHFVRPKAMEEVHKLRAQISNIVQINFPGMDVGFVPKLKPPTDLQLKVLRQLLTAAFIDQVAVRKDLVDRQESTGVQYATAKGVPYRAIGIADDVFIHPSSILANNSPPDYITFTEIVQTSRLYIKGLTIIDPAWLSSLGKTSLCTFSKPIKNNAGTLMVIPRFGPEGWELPAVKAELS